MLMKYTRILMLALVAMVGFTAPGQAESGREIDDHVNATLEHFYSHVRGGHELARKARGVLVFPAIIKAGIGIGGEYGEGALRIDGQTADYYNSVSASIGFQLGVEQRSVVILFMTDGALESFRHAHGWKVGVDGSIAIITLGVGASVDSSKITSPVVGFILDPKGLMYNLTLEGSKISRISK